MMRMRWSPLCWGVVVLGLQTALAEPTGVFTDAAGVKPFAQPRPMTDDAYDRFILGRSFFHIPWVAAPGSTTARDGLGPHFNANTCNRCHIDGGSAPTLSDDRQPLRALVFKLSQPGQQAQRWRIDDPDTPNHGSVPDPVYGVQVAINGSGSVAPEARTRLRVEQNEFIYPDGRTVALTRFHPDLDRLAYGPLDDDTVIALRQPPALAGLGLIEQIPQATILAWADPDDSDGNGISGRANWLQPPGRETPVLGRFNWKATEATVVGQVANAAAHDMGLTNPQYPDELCTPAQSDCRAAPRGVATPQGRLDLPDIRLQAIAAYVEGHKAPRPATLDERARQGRDLFDAAGCAACHRPTLTTQAGLDIHPYSDFLLHDMGAALQDGRPEFLASEREFRTAPLWGLGGRLRANNRFLHDARAATPEAAILWHDGEAAASKTRFIELDRDQRDALLHFLEQL